MVSADTKQIDCPEHPGQHWATLYCYPHKYAGIWECGITGTSDSHDHHDDPDAEIEIETFTQDHLGFQGHYQTESRGYICGGKNGCGITLEGDPDERDE